MEPLLAKKQGIKITIHNQAELQTLRKYLFPLAVHLWHQMLR